MDTASIPDLSLAESLEIVARHFDTSAIAAQSIDQASVLDYFKQSRRGYRLFHSKQGAMHVALNHDDEFSTDGYLGQVDLLAEQLRSVDAQQSLEIGCGTGFNARNLAEQMPSRCFLGLDLAAGHVDLARREAKRLENVTFETGDFQQLPFGDECFDAVFAVECLCQASEMQRAIAEAFRVLRPGGRLIVIDCFRADALSRYEAPMQLAVQLVEKTMAVDQFWLWDEWLVSARQCGFKLIEQRDLSEEISHNIARFYSLARRFFKMPRAARAFLKAFPERLLQNAISGLLMPFTVSEGPHRYYFCVLERPEME